MKLFIWDDKDTLVDHSHGLITALAIDLEEAVAVVRKELDSDHPGWHSFNEQHPTEIIDVGWGPETPRAWWCNGSA
jgi:hypothetical protein